MVSRLRLCRATQSARASATVPRASTSTASCSPKIKVDVIGSKPSASPKGFGRSPTIAFPGAVKTFTPSVVSMSARMTVQCKISRSATMNLLDERINQCPSIGQTWLPERGVSPHPEKFLGRFVEFRPAVRLYREGRATARPRTKEEGRYKIKDRY